jgi:autotransporter-associated beta strand protein
LGDFSGDGTLNGPGGLVVNGNFTNFANATVSLGNLVVGGTNIILANGSALTVASNFNLQAASVTTQELISGDPNSGPGALTTEGNINVNHGVELEYMTWNFDLGTNVMNMTGKLTIGKIPGLPVSVEWISGTGLWAANDYFAMADSLGNNPGSIGELDVSGGSLTISNTTYRCLIGNGGAATINVSGGSLQFAGPTSIQLGGDTSFPQTGASGTLTISDSGSVTIGPASLGLSLAANNGVASGITGTINLNGGTLTTWPKIANGTNNANGQSFINFNGGTLKAGTNNSSFLQGLTQATVQSGGAIIDDGGHAITIGQSLVDGGSGGGLTKLGSGTLILTNTSTYSGSTTVSNGTLEVDGNLSASSVTVASGGALSGNGTLGAGVTVNAGGTLAPGTNAPGILTINGSLELDGSLQIAVNKALTISNSMVTVSGSVVNGGTGTVAITNAGSALAVGDTFQVFNSPVANGAALTVAGGGAGVVWTNKLALDGSIQVLSAAAPINPLPGVVQFNVSGNTLNLFWPTNAGWILQTQTNALSVGLNTNWVTVPGSTSVTNLSVTINPTNGAVFYRMTHP